MGRGGEFRQKRGYRSAGKKESGVLTEKRKVSFSITTPQFSEERGITEKISIQSSHHRRVSYYGLSMREEEGRTTLAWGREVRKSSTPSP